MLASAGAVVGLSFEERALLAGPSTRKHIPNPQTAEADLPKGKIKHVEMGRLIIGSNLFGGGAHSRDLKYVSTLLRKYNTPEKLMDTLQLCEENGIDMNIGGGRLINKYNTERDGKMRWLGQLSPKENDLTSSVQRAIDNGAVGAFIWGAQADRWVQLGRMDLIDGFVSFVKQNGLIAGVGCHSKYVPLACEKAGIDNDFYFKTLHPGNYWSATPREERFDYMVDSGVWGGENDYDNIWSIDPEETIEIMSKIKKSWIAYKVLAAGGVHPMDGFKYALENGADFLCVGMLDFQIQQNVSIVKENLANLEKSGRKRPWIG